MKKCPICDYVRSDDSQGKCPACNDGESAQWPSPITTPTTPMDTPTPETDAFINMNGNEDDKSWMRKCGDARNFCRKLERERDEARATCQSYVDTIKFQDVMIEALKSENASLSAKLEEWKKWGNRVWQTLSGDQEGKILSFREKILKEYDVLTEEDNQKFRELRKARAEALAKEETKS